MDALVDLALRDARQARRIRLAVRDYAATGTGDVKKLAGRESEWRLRAGDWRVIFTMETGRSAIHILALRLRRDAYR